MQPPRTATTYDATQQCASHHLTHTMNQAFYVRWLTVYWNTDLHTIVLRRDVVMSWLCATVAEANSEHQRPCSAVLVSRTVVPIAITLLAYIMMRWWWARGFALLVLRAVILQQCRIVSRIRMSTKVIQWCTCDYWLNSFDKTHTRSSIRINVERFISTWSRQRIIQGAVVNNVFE